MNDSSQALCREFYANAYTVNQGRRREYMSMVRGKQIAYNPSRLQQLLQTAFHEHTHGGDCHYQVNLNCIRIRPHQGIRNYATWDPFEEAAPVLQTIAKVGQQWDPTRDRRKPRRLYSHQLNGIAKVWYHYIISNVMPMTNQTEVIVKRAVLIHTIMTGDKIDLPKIIADSMYEMAHSNFRNGALGHSTIVQLLCQDAGVDIPVEARPVRLNPKIDAAFIKYYITGQDELEHQADQAQPQPAPPRQRTVEQRLAVVEDTQATMVRTLAGMERRQRHMHRSQLHFQEYLSARMADFATESDIPVPAYHPIPYSGSDEEAPSRPTMTAPSSSRHYRSDTEEDTDEEDEEVVYRDIPTDTED